MLERRGIRFDERFPRTGVGCVVVESQMPGMSGPQLQARLRASGVSLPIVYLTSHADVPKCVHAMKIGSFDLLQKPADGDAIIAAVGAAVSRHESIALPERELADVVARIAKLSPREHEVMECVICGRLNKQIAGDLGISEKTVKAHRGRMMEKLECGCSPVWCGCALADVEPAIHQTPGAP